jgi:hypothetical protein
MSILALPERLLDVNSLSRLNRRPVVVTTVSGMPDNYGTIAAGTTSTGGLTALARKKLRAPSGRKSTPKPSPSQET